MEKYYFEIPTLDRKEDALDYLREHKDANSTICGSGGLNKCLVDITYEEWLSEVNNLTKKDYALKRGFVPSSTFFTIRKSDNKIIGMINFRHYLDKATYMYGGHIGYGIRPKERQKGYAKIQLYMALREAKKMGIDKVMIQCFNTNEASNRTIRALGGIRDKDFFNKYKDIVINAYWIDVDESLEKYKNIYDQYI